MPCGRYTVPAIALAANAALFAAALCGAGVGNLALTAAPDTVAAAPWSIVTYMFLQVYPVHFVINFAALAAASWWFMRRGGASAYALTYLLGGICGALAFLATCALAGVPQASLAGCSASVMALVGAVLADRRRHIRHAAVIAAVIAVVAATGAFGSNPGGSMAHVAGLLAGFIIGRIASRPKSPAAATADPIVKKAMQSGYLNLTPDERRRLFYRSSDNEKKTQK